ncbi:MFS transporter [Williamsia phyllosphaerae]|uniref:MFS transporter n=1 Tax=Williamsia phyllosphaerae TaxID=885042 RepID=A0ABQ1U3X2_9NOCA|nr:MFS transporter [Williamsia phyllosphaerae]GGF10320.1 MFS transporter [Williamsia phyllosphaerae]
METETYSARRKWIILCTCCLSLLIVSMDATIVNVALPAIRRDLGASVSGLQWVIDIYTLVLASLLLLSGAMADRLGRRRIFQIGLVVFALGSLLCSLSTSVEMLIAARFVQAIGGSMLNPVAMSIITQVFTGRAERARAIGVWGAVVGISMALGPMVGGVLIDLLDWKAVFWINLPICAAAIILAAIFVPESRSATVRKLDPLGQGLGILFMASLISGLIEGPNLGWGDPRTLGIFALALIGLVGFIRHEGRHASPFIDLRFFRSVPFATATVIGIVAFSAYGGFLFLMSNYLQNVRGYSAVHTGLIYLPIAIGTLIFSPISGRLVGRYGTRPSLIASGLLLAVASVLLTTFTPTTPVWLLIIAFGLFGVGFGLVNAPITTSAVSGMPRDRAGAASAVASTSRQLGVSLGVAISGSIAGAAVTASDSAFTDAVQPLWWITTGLALSITALGIISTTGWAKSTVEKTAFLFVSPSEPKAPAHV